MGVHTILIMVVFLCVGYGLKLRGLRKRNFGTFMYGIVWTVLSYLICILGVLNLKEYAIALFMTAFGTLGTYVQIISFGKRELAGDNAKEGRRGQNAS